MNQNIKILYHDKEMPKLKFVGGEKSDWIDVRAVGIQINGAPFPWRDEKKLYYNAGDTLKINLGISAELPAGYEAHLLPRGSTFKNYGIILTNSTGIIDESYKGPDDVWFATFYALKDGSIEQYDRIGQFRIQEKMTDSRNSITLQEVEYLGNDNRGGEGSTGNR